MGHKTKLRLRKAYPQHWYDISYGNSKSHITLIVDTQNKAIRCEITIPDSKEMYQRFCESKDAIEKELNEKLEWLELPGRKSSRIVLAKKADVLNEDDWENQFKWLMEKAESFSNVFGKYKL